MEQRIERQMNKTALVTLWVDPVEHQIVKYTFDNVWMDFLPGGWFVKVDDIRASMTMGQPFPGIWLPREMNIHAGVTMAMGSLEAAYARRFSDYKQADVKSLIRIPKQPISADPPPTSTRRTRRRRRAGSGRSFRSPTRPKTTRRRKSIVARSAYTATPTCAMTRSSSSPASASDSPCPQTACATSSSG